MPESLLDPGRQPPALEAHHLPEVELECHPVLVTEKEEGVRPGDCHHVPCRPSSNRAGGKGHKGLARPEEDQGQPQGMLNVLGCHMPLQGCPGGSCHKGGVSGRKGHLWRLAGCM